MPPPDFAEPIDAPPSAAVRARRTHWQRTTRLTAVLLLVWFGIGFVVSWFARDLDFPFFGWPFSFWVAAQGGTIAFVVLLVVYARRMTRLDRRLDDDGGAGDEPVSVFDGDKARRR
jgi:putative solute:sodium symporter small subunit